MASKIIVDQVQKTGGTSFTLPASDGSINQLMKTDGSGNLGFVSSAVGGKILQVLQHELGTTISTTSTSYVASGLTITITPATTSSRFILQCTGGTCWTTVAGNYAHCTFYVGGVEVSPNGPYEVIKQCNSVSPPMQSPHSMLMIHSPGSVSDQTYTVYYKTNSATTTFNETSARVQLTVTELNS